MSLGSYSHFAQTGAVACYKKGNESFCGWPPCSSTCQEGLPEAGGIKFILPKTGYEVQFKFLTDYLGASTDKSYAIVTQYFESSFIGNYCSFKSNNQLFPVAGKAYGYAAHVKIKCAGIAYELFKDYLYKELRNEILESEGIVIFTGDYPY